MKFGERFAASQIKQWSGEYVGYDQLKTQLQAKIACLEHAVGPSPRLLCLCLSLSLSVCVCVCV